MSSKSDLEDTRFFDINFLGLFLFWRQTMIRNSFLTSIIPLLLICVIGCSGNHHDPIGMKFQKDDLSSIINTDQIQSNRSLMGMWNINLDLAAKSASVIPSRDNTLHMNITSYIPEPQVEIIYYDEATFIVAIEVTVENPYPTAVFDVRLVYYQDENYELLNADSWTPLYDIPGGLPINPFKAYAKDQSNRKFAGSTNYKEQLYIQLDDGGMFWNLPCAVDASLQNNCEEPYEIKNIKQDDVIFDTISSSTTLTADVYDWQNDVSDVSLYCPLVTGQTLVKMNHISGSIWGYDLVNSTGAAAGSYLAAVIAKSTGSGSLSLYNAFQVEIKHFDSSLSITSVDPTSGPPGRIVSIYCSGIEEGSEGVAVFFNDQLLPSAYYEKGRIVIGVPALPSGTYNLRVTTNDGAGDSISFSVDPVPTPQYTQQEFASLIENGTENFNRNIKSIITDLDLNYNLFNDDLMADINQALGNVSSLDSLIKNEINNLSTEDANTIQCIMKETGLIDLFDDIDRDGGAIIDRYGMNKSIYDKHHMYAGLDLISSVLTASSTALDIATVALILTTGPVGGVVLILKLAVTVIDYIIDTIVTTDFSESSTYPIFIKPNSLSLKQGEFKQIEFYGWFRTQGGMLTNTFKLAFSLIAPIIAKMKLPYAELIATIYKNLAKSGIDLEKNICDLNDIYIYDTQPVRLDINYYTKNPVVHLGEIFPFLLLDFFLSIIDKITGSNFTNLQPVQTDPGIAVYHYDTENLEALNVGNSILIAKGYSFRNYYGIEWPVYVQSDPSYQITVTKDMFNPTARAAAYPLTQKVGQPVHFYDNGSSDPDGTIVDYAWEWNCQGSYLFEGSDTYHVWNTVGQKCINFMVIDNDGLPGYLSPPIYIDIIPASQEPIAKAKLYPTSGRIGENWPAVFEDDGSNDPDGSVVLYEWDFDYDGEPTHFVTEATGTHVEHKYTGINKTYHPTLRVKDNSGYYGYKILSITSVNWVNWGDAKDLPFNQCKNDSIQYYPNSVDFYRFEYTSGSVSGNLVLTAQSGNCANLKLYWYDKYAGTTIWLTDCTAYNQCQLDLGTWTALNGPGIYVFSVGWNSQLSHDPVPYTICNYGHQ